MTPSEKWILGLCAVYGIPSFLSGVGVTLLFVRLRDRRTKGVTPHLLSPDRSFAPRELQAAPAAPADGLRRAI